jgi:ferritin
MVKLIGDTLRNSLIEQIGHEKYNANLYMYICGFLRSKGLDNLSKHFLEQHEEETVHSLEFFNLLTDLNADVTIPEIDGIQLPFENIIDVATAYLNREILTTDSISEILKLSIQDNNPVVEQKCREMITKQQKEYEEATTFLDRATLMPEWWQCVIWDATGG